MRAVQSYNVLRSAIRSVHLNSQFQTYSYIGLDMEIDTNLDTGFETLKIMIIIITISILQ